jgi:hypothetical protein
MKYKASTLLIGAFLLVPSLVMGQNYVLQSHVIGSGAVNGSSTNFKAQGTVGQSAIGTGTSTNFKGSWGFWYTLSGGGGASGVFADLNVFLEGPYSGGSMTAGLAASVPTSQPFSGSPWSYPGTESVASGFFASNPTIVDWVFVQARDTTPGPLAPPMNIAASRAGFVKTDGSIVDTNGVDPLHFPSLGSGTYYVVVDHRNHASAMSAAGVATSSSALDYDFTDAMAKAYTLGPAPMRALTGAKFGLFAGDGTTDGQVNASDFNTWLIQTKAVATGYIAGDYNLDAGATALDFNLWLFNTKAVAKSQVPAP